MKMEKEDQALTNSMHVYYSANDVHAHSIMHTGKFVHSIDCCVKII